MSSTGTSYGKADPSNTATRPFDRPSSQGIERPAVLCDFDDTTAVENVAELLLKEFCPALDWQQLRQRSRDRLISLKEYQERAFQSIKASREEMQALVRKQATLRPHFKDLRDYTDRMGIPLAIVTVGLDFYVDALLVREGLEDVPRYAATTCFTNGAITFSYPHRWDGSGAATEEVCSQWGTCKCSILNKYKQRGHHIFYVGDGRSDMCPASIADHIFARSMLADFCTRDGIPFTPFDTFMDVIQVLEAQRLEQPSSLSHLVQEPS